MVGFAQADFVLSLGFYQRWWLGMGI